MYRVILYETSRKDCPSEEFIRSLPIRVRAKINRWISLLEQHGPNLPRPYADIIRGEVRELRVSFGSSEYRFLYAFFGKVILITHGFIKKSDEVPESEILRAEHIIEDFRRRNGL